MGSICTYMFKMYFYIFLFQNKVQIYGTDYGIVRQGPYKNYYNSICSKRKKKRLNMLSNGQLSKTHIELLKVKCIMPGGDYQQMSSFKKNRIYCLRKNTLI